MAHKVIAILVGALLVTLFEHGFLRAADLSMDSSIHASVKVTAAALEEAIRANEDGEEKTPHKVATQPKAYDPFLIEIILHQRSKERSRLKKACPDIYKLHHTFLI